MQRISGGGGVRASATCLPLTQKLYINLVSVPLLDRPPADHYGVASGG